MSEEKKKSGLSRREFLQDAGLVVGGAAVGSVGLISACKSSPAAVVPGVTTTVTSPPVTTTSTVSQYVDPIDGTNWPSVAALKAHFNAVHPNADATLVAFNVNGVGYAFQVKPWWSLAYVLRESLQLYALKQGCMLGECGACTVLVDNVATFSCMNLAIEMEGRNVTTVEGLTVNGTLSPVQQKFYDQEATGCGFCTPGFIMASQGLLNAKPKPTLSDVQLALSGHMCMCCNVHRTVTAIVGGV